MRALRPGTALRDGLTRILLGDTGALIVLGNNDAIEHMSGGGFAIDVEFTATRLRELAKMDGAIILTPNADRILSAGVQLLPMVPYQPKQAPVTARPTVSRNSQGSRLCR